MPLSTISLCFFSFLRSGEITVPSGSSFDITRHLSYKDVSVDKLYSPIQVRIQLKASKINSFREGMEVFLGRSGFLQGPI